MPTQTKHIILIVEDETSLRNALQKKLTHEGFSVLEAKDGQEGLEVSLREHPDLILLDNMMPKMDGMTMLKKMREDGWGKSAKVIILSNLSENEKVAEAMSHETFDYIVKSDSTIEHVVEAVRTHLGENLVRKDSPGSR